VAEFFHEVRMGHDVEASGSCGLGEELPVSVPDCGD
jgi:hypothetical protein